MINLTVNGTAVAAENDDSILTAARKAEIYIPALCHHPDLPPRKGGKPLDAVYQGGTRVEHDPSGTPGGELESGCGLCVVEMGDSGELKPACVTPAAAGMQILTDTHKVKAWREEKLVAILRDHPHACLTCAQQQGCPRTQCSSNVPENERCCPQLGNCELQKVADFIGISPATPRWLPTSLPTISDDPLFERNYNLCIGCTRCVRACRDLRGIEAIGFVVDKAGKVRIGSVAPTLKESGCKFCTACVEVCPTGALTDRGLKTGKKDLLPCVHACPAGIDIPWYLRLIAEGKSDDALAVIRQAVPFPGILGRVCVRPCESVCRRAEVNEPISICALKRFASDNGTDSWKAEALKATDTGMQVAVIGAGPAGLTAAFYLRKKGHSVTVFDANEKAGGMMRYGIPRHRLPDEVLDKEIGEIFGLGVGFRPKTKVGEDVTTARLRDTFNAIFVATGAPLSRRIPLDGADLPEVLWGLEFLREVGMGIAVNGGPATGVPTSMDGKVVVIGGGAVAIDAALTARRLGASEVRLVCLEDREEMPAHPWEIKGAEEEGVIIHNCWGPMEIVEQARSVRGICFKRCVCVYDSDGTFNPSYDDECAMGLEADTIILAIGQSSDPGFVQAEGVNVRRNFIEIDEKTLETNVPGIFAGGDATAFPGAVIHAVADGRKAASAIDKYLGGDGVIDEKLVPLPRLNHRVGREQGFAGNPRLRTRKVPVADRTDFREVDLGLGHGDAVAEAARCLQCDLRLAISEIEMPPEHILPFTQENVMKVPEIEGAFRVMNGEKKPLVVKGCANMRALLLEFLDSLDEAEFFDYEEDKMFSKRESELVQQHLQKYGEMPGGEMDDDDLF